MYTIKRCCSSVVRGTNFEILACNVMNRYGFHLHRKGGAGDLGVDLQGVWQLENEEECKLLLDQQKPTAWPFINVISQCKHEKRNCKPAYVRELDGVLSRWTANMHKTSTGYFIPSHLSNNTKIQNSHQNVPILGVLICSKGFTQSCITALQYSQNPMMFATIESLDIPQDKPVDDKWYQCRLKFCKLNKQAQVLLPNLRIGNTFSGGSTLENSHPSIVMFNNEHDLSENKLPS